MKLALILLGLLACVLLVEAKSVSNDNALEQDLRRVLKELDDEIEMDARKKGGKVRPTRPPKDDEDEDRPTRPPPEEGDQPRPTGRPNPAKKGLNNMDKMKHGRGNRGKGKGNGNGGGRPRPTGPSPSRGPEPSGEPRPSRPPRPSRGPDATRPPKPSRGPDASRPPRPSRGPEPSQGPAKRGNSQIDELVELLEKELKKQQ